MRLAYDNRELGRVRDFLLQLTKRRGQAKKAIIDMIQWGQKLVEQLPTRDEKYKLLQTLQEASEGKMFLEREYSQVVREQAEMLEGDGKVDDATKLVQEI